MKKIVLILSLSVIFASCKINNAVSEIDQFVVKINTRNDLEESITEYIIEDLNDSVVGGESIYELTDTEGQIYRIIAHVVHPNKPPMNYRFYFKKDTLTFANIIQYSDSGNDTVINSNYYFSGSELIYQLDKMKNDLDPKTVREASEYYRDYSKDTND